MSSQAKKGAVYRIKDLSEVAITLEKAQKQLDQEFQGMKIVSHEVFKCVPEVGGYNLLVEAG